MLAVLRALHPGGNRHVVGHEAGDVALYDGGVAPQHVLVHHVDGVLLRHHCATTTVSTRPPKGKDMQPRARHDTHRDKGVIASVYKLRGG